MGFVYEYQKRLCNVKLTVDCTDCMTNRKATDHNFYKS